MRKINAYREFLLPKSKGGSDGAVTLNQRLFTALLSEICWTTGKRLSSRLYPEAAICHYFSLPLKADRKP